MFDRLKCTDLVLLRSYSNLFLSLCTVKKAEKSNRVKDSPRSVRVTTDRKNTRNRGRGLKMKKSQSKKYFNSKTMPSLVATSYYFCSFNHNLQLFFPQTTSAESCKA